MAKTLVSVITTTRNSAQTLGSLFASIKDQTNKNFEIIVVDNNSTDETKKIARKFTKKVFNFGPERSAQRNFGARKARGDYLLVLDSDMVLTKNVVSECVTLAQANPSIMEIVIPEKSSGVGFWAKTKAFERELNEGESFFEAARFFRKKIFWKFGGYDERLTGPEDWDLSQRIAKIYKVGRVKNYILHNEGKPTLFGLARRKFYYGLSFHKYLRKQSLPLVGPTTIYFLRPAFWRNWQRLVRHPLLSLGMFIMLGAELVGGGLGYASGRIKGE